MRILIIGASGQLARCFAERARLQPGVELAALSRLDLDLGIPGSAIAAISKVRPDVVINAGAFTAVDQAEDEPGRAFRINADAAGEVAAAAAMNGAAIVQISTDYVFDGRSCEVYDELSDVNPLSTYGRSKLAGEEAVRAANPRHAIIRSAWIYSPFGRNFVKSIMAAALVRDQLTVVDDQCGNPTCALDLADGLIAMLEAGGGWGETYHLAASGSATWCEFAREIMAQCAALGIRYVPVEPIKTEDWPTRAVRPCNSAMSSKKFEETFGFAMPDWRHSVRHVVERIAASQSSQAECR